MKRGGGVGMREERNLGRSVGGIFQREEEGLQGGRLKEGMN